MLKIVIILVLGVSCLALHTHHQIEHLLNNPKRHLQIQTGSPAFEESFADLGVLVARVKQLLTRDTQKYEFLLTKTSQIQAGLNKLKETLLSYNLSVTNTSELCPGVTTFDRTELRKYISYTQIKERGAVQFLSTCLDCSFVSNDIFLIQNLTNSYIRNLNKTLDGGYCKLGTTAPEKATGIVNLNNSYFKSNLNAKNWYYGSTTASDYKIYIFKRSSSYNLTSCPLNTPFVQDQQQICFDCSQGNIFNLGTQKCDTCLPNQILNIQSGKCDQCLGQKKFINGSLVCKLCILSEGRLFNETNGKCYKCGNDSYLDTEKLACIKIYCDPNTPRFNTTTKQCQSCGLSQIIDPADLTKCKMTNYIGLCPPTTPQYDENTKKCVACPNNTQYNKANNFCETTTNSAHLFSLNLASHQSYISKLDHQASNVSSIPQCPSDKPKYNGVLAQCQACQSGFEYDYLSKVCQRQIICGPTQTANKTTSSCVDTSSTCRPNEVYVIKINRCLAKSATCSVDQYYNPDLQTCISISSSCNKQQFYDAQSRKCTAKQLRCKGDQNYNEELNICQKMILCKQDEDLNFQLRICEKKSLKCKPTEYFDPKILACVGYTFITSPYGFNLIYDANFKEYINQYQNTKSSNSNIKDCPLNAPFYQKSSKNCIICPDDSPYFDIVKDSCISCPQKQLYEPSHHRCISQDFTPVSTTINRMNI